jgi:hypothetical protein
MNSFDAIIEHCPAIRQWVRVDQTRDECAQQHRCPQDRVCPIGACFAKAGGVAAAPCALTGTALPRAAH